MVVRSRSWSRRWRWNGKRSRSKNWSRRDRVRRWRAEGSLEDRNKARCRSVGWEGDNITEGLQGRGEEENQAWC